MQIPAESVLQCKRQFARSGQIFAPPDAAHAQCRPGRMLPSPPPAATGLRQTVHTHRASVHQAAKLVAALLWVARVTAGLAESNGSLSPGL